MPNPFEHTQHDVDNPFSPVLAIARVGGKGGQVYVYSEDTQAHLGSSFQSSSSGGGGGRRWF
jgi:hypothetical protein